MKTPKSGDKFFTGFEDEFKEGNIANEILIIEEVGEVEIDEKGREGRCVWCKEYEEGSLVGFDCFWSEKNQHFVYGLND